MFALMAFAVTATVAATAGESNRRQRACCPRCGEVCISTVTVGKEKKYCWEVDTKTICIPKIRFPWERDRDSKECCKTGCLAPKSARTKCVKILLKREYECDVCKYRWDVDSKKRRERSRQDVPPPPPVEARNNTPQQYVSPLRIKTPMTTIAPKPRKGYRGSLLNFLK
jgi:hypothetical protein